MNLNSETKSIRLLDISSTSYFIDLGRLFIINSSLNEFHIKISIDFLFIKLIFLNNIKINLS